MSNPYQAFSSQLPPDYVAVAPGYAEDRSGCEFPGLPLTRFVFVFAARYGSDPEARLLAWAHDERDARERWQRARRAGDLDVGDLHEIYPEHG